MDEIHILRNETPTIFGAKSQQSSEKMHKIFANIDPSRMKEPSFKMVVIGVGQYAYQRPDGVKPYCFMDRVIE